MSEQVSVEAVEFSDDQQTAFVTTVWKHAGPLENGYDRVRIAIPLEIIQSIGAAVGNRPDIARSKPSSDRMAVGE